MPLIQLSYRSIRPPATTDEIVTDGIVLPAMRFNREHDITGCLWVGPAVFYQVLEGRAHQVDALYASIARDPRHRSVELLSRAPTEERQFARFSMKLVTLDESDQITDLLAQLPPGTVPPVPPIPAAPAHIPAHVEPKSTSPTSWLWQPSIVREIVSRLVQLPSRLGS